MTKSQGFLSKFTVLKTAPRELWIIYLTKVFEIIAYGVMTSIFVLFLSSDIGLSDQSAGIYIAVWSSIVTVTTILVGPLTDSIGVKKTLFFGFLFCVLSRFLVAFNTEIFSLSILGFIPLALGHAMMIPVMTAAMKQYSSPEQRPMAFSLYYTLMNVGFLFSGPIIDFFRNPERMGETGGWVVPFINFHISTYQFLFFVAFIATIPGLILVSFFMRDGVLVEDDGSITVSKKKKEKYSSFSDSVVLPMKKAGKDTIKTFGELIYEKSFQRFLLLLLLIVGVKLTFYHMHFTFPKYAIRILGEGAKFGTVWGFLNPFVIIVLVPILGAVTQKVTAYKMLLIGTTFSAISIFMIALPWQLFEPLVDTWLGKFIWSWWLGIDPGLGAEVLSRYISISFFVLIFSIGESIWSPRLYEYTASVAPRGKEASYMSLSLLPFFMAKLIVGGISGFLLSNYCPSDTDCQSSWMIWVIIGSMAIVAPIGLLTLRRVIQPKTS